MRTCKPALQVAIALALASCAHGPGPVEVRMVEVVRPVAVACVKPEQIPAMPAKVGDQLTGGAVNDASVLAAANLRLRAALGKALALLGGCVTGN